MNYLCVAVQSYSLPERFMSQYKRSAEGHQRLTHNHMEPHLQAWLTLWPDTHLCLDVYPDSMKLMDAPYDISAPDWQVETTEAPEPQLSEAEKHRWIWLFERLKRADLGLSFSEKAKIFCEASAPEEVEDFIQSEQHDDTIIPLAA